MTKDGQVSLRSWAEYLKCTGKVKYGRPLRKLLQFPIGTSVDTQKYVLAPSSPLYFVQQGDALIEHLPLITKY